MKIKYLNYPISSIIFVFIYFLSILNMGNPLVFGKKPLPLSMHIIFILVFMLSLPIIMKNRFIKVKLLSSYFILSLCVLPSIIYSEYIDVSFFKFFSFSIGMFSLIYLSNNINITNNNHKKNIYIDYRNINRLSILFSLIIYFLGLGYTANETGFSGVLNHPQSFGVFLVLIVAVELYGIQSKASNVRWSIFVIIIAFILSLMTESRLSIISIAVLLVFFAFLFFKIKITHLLALLLLVFSSIFMMDKIQDKVQTVLSKSGRSNTSGFEALEESRGFLISASINNFKDNPLAGIGFQVSNGKYGSYNMYIIREPIFGLPIEAVVEKGVFWTALIEEVGLFGSLGFIFFIFSYYKTLPKKIGLMIISTFILIGLGESFFFTLGGMGAFAWCTFFMFYATTDTSNKKHNAPMLDFIK